MNPSFLVAIDFRKPSQWREEYRVKYLKNLYAKVDCEQVEAALYHLQKTLGAYDTYLDVTELEEQDEIVELLDAGAASIFASPTQIALLSKVENVESQRLIPLLESNTASASQEVGSYTHGPLLIHDILDVSSLSSIINQRDHSDGPVFARTWLIPATDPIEIAKAGAIPIVPVTSLTFEKEGTPEPMGRIRAAQLFLANATSDRPDGLFTTLVVDEQGVALGLVYSSYESVAESLRTGRGVYHSRKRGLWYKGETSGDVQELISIASDCDRDCLCFTVSQVGRGFCHLGTATCMGEYKGLSKLQKTLKSRKASAPAGSYTARLFSDPDLLSSKIREEAQELCDATEKDHIAFEAADLFYFAIAKCIASDVSLEDIERNLDAKSIKVKRRKGDAKPQYAKSETAVANGNENVNGPSKDQQVVKEVQSVSNSSDDPVGTNRGGRIRMDRYITSQTPPAVIQEALRRPSQKSTEKIMGIVKPIIEDVRTNGDRALLSYTHKFEKATSLQSPVLHAPFSSSLMKLPPETIEAIDVSFENIRKFHTAQKETKPLQVETMPGVVCSRFARAIERVGLYVPGGTAVLPSSALMLGVPAMVAGCKKIVLATPPRSDGTLTPEIVYVAHKVGAESIVLAGGAQAIAAMAYGTESISKVDKILGPGNQFVTAGKMLVSNDTTANVSIDMPAGPSEVLVVADKTSNPTFVAADLLSQAEHGVDSQVICIAIDLNEDQLAAIEDELHRQATALPRVDIVRGAIEHSVTVVVKNVEEAMSLSNDYAPEHLIIQSENPETAAELVENAGSVFIGPWTPESVGDYSAGVNHSLPTYGYARQYSGVNLGSYIKHITSSHLSEQGLKNVGGAVMQLAKVEELEAHRRAVSIRLGQMRDGAA